MNPVEIIAALLGVINVSLIVRRSVWNYPFGIAMVCLYAFVFYEARLYSDMLLQGFFLIVQIYGWWNWARADEVRGGVAVSWLSWPGRAAWIAGAAIFSVALGWVMARYTDAAAPFADSTIAGFSIAAQFLMAFRRIENWVLWIAVDVLAVGLFISRELYVTAGLYAVFLVLATAGLIGWMRTHRRAAGVA